MLKVILFLNVARTNGGDSRPTHLSLSHTHTQIHIHIHILQEIQNRSHGRVDVTLCPLISFSHIHTYMYIHTLLEIQGRSHGRVEVTLDAPIYIQSALKVIVLLNITGEIAWTSGGDSRRAHFASCLCQAPICFHDGCCGVCCSVLQRVPACSSVLQCVGMSHLLPRRLLRCV